MAIEITPELVLKRVRAAGGRLVLDGLDADELVAWRHAAKVPQLRLHRAGRERLRKYSNADSLTLDLVEVDRKGQQVRAARDDDEPWVPPAPVVPRTTEFVGRVVPAPATVTKPHPLVDQLVAAVELPERRMQALYGSWRAPATRRPLAKMRRIWQAIIKEALFQNLRWQGCQVWAVHDWDSLGWQPEAALVGAASGSFASAGPPTLAPIESSEAFLVAYQDIRGRLFTAVELEIAWAASLWMAAYNAREMALRGDTPVGGDALRAQAAERLRRADA